MLQRPQGLYFTPGLIIEHFIHVYSTIFDNGMIHITKNSNEHELNHETYENDLLYEID